MNKIYLYSILLVLLYTSCSTRNYATSEVKNLSKHRIIAVLPSGVNYNQRGQIMPKQMEEISENDALMFQTELQNWLQLQIGKKELVVKVQDVQTTNSLLTKAGVEDINNYTSQELAEILGVDGVIISTFTLEQPFTYAESVIVDVVLNKFPTTNNKARGNISLYDRHSNSLVWNYISKKTDMFRNNNRVTSPADLVFKMMRSATRKLPYKNTI